MAFLIADFSGDALVRLSHGGAPAARTSGRERAERLPLEGTVHGQVLATQRVGVLDEGEVWRVLAPVTNRGEAIGVLELSLAQEPDEQRVADVALGRARAGVCGDRQPSVH